ncbi:MAG: hypothetical protein A2X79_03380 [Desulfuromonadaceae bacterium GWB2_53_15]|nr:MAG: hypothetical protein A2X83_03545 [Desulfuromonadales bacterium GWD2_54_10]OHB30444.1 MAG: hypothetical protein A2X79_03380 [Desulfuromonadaceae bacterium GWB2_53_15]
MVKETIEIKILHEIEYKVIGNAFGVLIATGGLLAGTMVRQRSFEYWQEDIVLIALLGIMSFNLMRSFVAAMTAYQVVPVKTQPARHRENVQPDQAVVAQIPAPVKYTAEQVMDEVAKRIESQKADAIKKNKMVNS